jgi:sigma-B regulation protein RsbU (phosphoserine phosphatase)
MRILVAEDDAVSRHLLRSALTRLGHDVADVQDGLAAWEVYQREYLPIVISDWMMPGLDGLALTRAIRDGRHGKYTYVILVTALEGKSRYMQGMQAGADDFLTKPVDLDELTARLRVADRMLSLQEEVKHLRGLLSTCMYCKNIRDGDTWVPFETYISKRSDASFSHGVCPKCLDTRLKSAGRGRPPATPEP